MKTKYDATMKPYPAYITQTRFHFIQPYGRKPRIANKKDINNHNEITHIKSEHPITQQSNIMAVQLSSPMEVEIDSGNDSDCMIVDN
jgi:hypothetical protein